MSISVSVPKEITDYKEKIIFGLSFRELICLIAAVLTGIASYAFCTQILKLSSEIAGYLVILISAPFLAVGFIRKDKLPFEKYIAFRTIHFFSQKQFCYETYQPHLNVSSDNSERKSNYAQLFQAKSNEADIFFIKRTKQKYKRKQALCSIRAAKKEYKQACQKAAYSKKHT